MSNSLQLPSEVRSFINKCRDDETRLSVVAKRLFQLCYVADLHPLYVNDEKPDPKDKRVMLWYDNEEHIKVFINNKPKPRLTEDEKDKENLNIFIGALVAERKLYSYRHRRHPKTPLLETNHTAFLKVALELASEKFDIEGMPLSALERCVAQSLKRDKVMQCFIHTSQRRYTKDRKVLSTDEKKALIAEYKKLEHREKALRSVLSIITAGKEDATQKEQAEFVGVSRNTLRSHFDIARETLDDNECMREHLKPKFTKEELYDIRNFLSHHARHDNGVGARGKRKLDEDSEIVSLLDYGESVAENRVRIGAELGRTIPRRTFYDILKRRGIPTTKFKNTKHIKNENTRNFQCGGVCQAAETVPECGSALYGEGL